MPNANDPAARERVGGCEEQKTLWVFDDADVDGPTNMARDELLLLSNELRPSALRLYGWRPATLSLGCFQRYDALTGLPPEFRDLPVVRRLTGGGAILHDREITYCLALDAEHPAAAGSPAGLYALVHRVWRRVLSAHGGPACEIAPDSYPLPTPRTGPFFCFEKPGRTDLLLAGGKVLGSAQRRLPTRVMQHGSLILARRTPAQPGGDLGGPEAGEVAKWREEFVRGLGQVLGLAPSRCEWSPEQTAVVARLRDRFAGLEWTRRM